MSKLTAAIATVLGVMAFASAQTYITDEVGAWHFHTYFFEVNPSKTAEAIGFRKASRQMIDDGSLAECSLNEIQIGLHGPHLVSQWEMCCNKTTYAAAHSWHTQNHGNLSVLIHPLTIYDQYDHMGGSSWLGKEVVVDVESPYLYPVLPKARPCPVYPRYSDDIPEDLENIVHSAPIPGTEDYKGRNKNFDILTDVY